MTFILTLPPEKEAALNAVAQAEGVSTEQWLQNLVEERLQSTAPTAATSQPRRHISERIVERMSKVPAEIMATMPTDGASDHDHYLYGHPKRDV
jgi:hypothetical protein